MDSITVSISKSSNIMMRVKSNLFKIVFVSLFIQVTIAGFAQPPGGTRGGGQGGQFAEIKSQNLAEILILDSDKIVKKGKVTGESETTVVKLTNEYNQVIDSIAYTHAATFIKCDSDIAQARKTAMNTRDFQLMQQAMGNVRSMIDPILVKVQGVRAEYMNQMQAVLPEKSYKKIKNYVTSQVKALKPQNANGGPSRTGGRGF